MNALWWTRLPTSLLRRLPTLGALLSDGRYLSAWPWIGAAAPVVALLIGAGLGTYVVHPGEEYTRYRFLWGESYTSYRSVMAAMTTLGHLGGALGLWSTIGYSIGNFFFVEHPAGYRLVAGTFDAEVRVRAGLLLSYAHLGALAAFIPTVANTIGGSVMLSRGMPITVRRPLRYAAHIIAAFVLTYAWALSMPMLIRPVYTWRGLPPQVLAIKPLQQWTWILPAVAAAVSAVRLALERASLRPRTVGAGEGIKSPAAASQLKAVIGSRDRRGGLLPLPFAIPLRATLATLLMAGLTTSWNEAAILLSVFVLCNLAPVMASHVESWQKTLAHIPIVARLFIALLASYLAGKLIIRWLWVPGATYLPVIGVMAAGLLITAVLMVPARQTAVDPRMPLAKPKGPISR
jgi:hypothetical protein